MNQVGLWMFWQPHQKVKIQWQAAKNLNPRFVTISNLGYWEIKCLKSINHTTVNRTNQKDRLLHPSKISGHILQNGDAIHLGISCFFRIISTNLMEINEPLIRSDFIKCREPRKNRKWCRSYESVIFPNNLEKKMQQYLQFPPKLTVLKLIEYLRIKMTWDIPFTSCCWSWPSRWVLATATVSKN